VLSAVVDKPASEIDARLGKLQAAEFLQETKVSPREYTFKHALIHEVVYASLVSERRRGLHASALRAFEELYPDRVAEHVESLARHAVGGEIWRRALIYLRQAGIAAAMRSAYSDAAAWHYSALGALTHLSQKGDVSARDRYPIRTLQFATRPGGSCPGL
jgi:predicted ATPase